MSTKEFTKENATTAQMSSHAIFQSLDPKLRLKYIARNNQLHAFLLSALASAPEEPKAAETER